LGVVALVGFAVLYLGIAPSGTVVFLASSAMAVLGLASGLVGAARDEGAIAWAGIALSLTVCVVVGGLAFQLAQAIQ
jgi:hypothetical protein